MTYKKELTFRKKYVTIKDMKTELGLRYIFDITATIFKTKEITER